MPIAPKSWSKYTTLNLLSLICFFILSNSISFLSCFSLLSLICLSICCFTKVPEFTSIFQFLFLFYHSTIHVSLFLKIKLCKICLDLFSIPISLLYLYHLLCLSLILPSSFYYASYSVSFFVVLFISVFFIL